MHSLKLLHMSASCKTVRAISNPSFNLQRGLMSRRMNVRQQPNRNIVPSLKPDVEMMQWPRKVFSGVQPTGTLHLGNYLGVVRKWIQLQNEVEDVTFCIVDMHTITQSHAPTTLRENIFQMAAALLACGIDPDKSTLFVQSAVKEHTELGWILSCHCTMARLGHLPQFKEKTRQAKEIPLGLFLYPVLQAADIMLYKGTHVPVGDDQVQHIQLAQHLAKTFNTKYGPTFPICTAVIDDKKSSRIRSLRDPTKKMSKSDEDPKAAIFLTDDADTIVQKVKKAVTDFKSDITYEPETRLGVSNLIAMHHLVTGIPLETILEESKTIDTGKYKVRVAEAVVEHLRPIREKIEQQLMRRNELMYLLEMGADKAKNIAAQTLAEAKQKVGLGALPQPLPQQSVHEHKEEKESQAEIDAKKAAKQLSFDIPEVPKQELRVEKRKKKMDSIKKENKGDVIVPVVRKEQPTAVMAKSNELPAVAEKEIKEIKL